MRTQPSTSAFTLIEIITAIAVIVTLTGLVISISGYVMREGSRARAKGEIAALSAACEDYKADHGDYPDPGPDWDIDWVNPKRDFIPTKPKYEKAGMFLYKELTGDRKGKTDEVPDGTVDDNERRYLKDFDRKMVKWGDAKVYFQDPFGYAYGYTHQDSANLSFNGASFDLWSTGGSRPGSEPAEEKDKQLEWAKWIKNW